MQGQRRLAKDIMLSWWRRGAQDSVNWRDIRLTQQCLEHCFKSVMAMKLEGHKINPTVSGTLLQIGDGDDCPVLLINGRGA